MSTKLTVKTNFTQSGMWEAQPGLRWFPLDADSVPDASSGAFRDWLHDYSDPMESFKQDTPSPTANWPPKYAEDVIERPTTGPFQTVSDAQAFSASQTINSTEISIKPMASNAAVADSIAIVEQDPIHLAQEEAALASYKAFYDSIHRYVDSLHPVTDVMMFLGGSSYGGVPASPAFSSSNTLVELSSSPSSSSLSDTLFGSRSASPATEYTDSCSCSDSDEEVILIHCPSACAHSDVESEADSMSDEEVILIQCPSTCAHSDVESEADSVVSTIYSVFANGSEASPDHPWDTESDFFGDVEEGGH